MSVEGEISLEVLSRLTEESFKQINTYIEAKMTATWFRETTGAAPKRDVVTNELIYHWITALQLPWECQYWHLSRLFTLIRVIQEKNQPKKKMPMGEIAQRNRDLNAQRQREMQMSG